jgi:pyruvate formate lyase activating enzyme
LLDRVPFTSPEEVVDYCLSNGAEGVSYTYTEPTVFFEYALDTMKLAREKGLFNVWVSNGYMTEKVLEYVKPFLDGINIDLKGNAKFYKEVCGHADINHVKENIEWCFEHKVHLEVTNLIIPGYNDKEKDFKEVSEFIASLSNDIPLHFTRFFPAYKMTDTPPTEVKVLEKAEKAARKAGLKHVYLGNIGEEENTDCPKCGAVLVKRRGFFAEKEHLDGSECGKCGEKIYLVP